MISPCRKHVLCPTGAGTDSPGVNYTSEHIDVPTFPAIYYPPTVYGTHTACKGLCISLVSQQDAELCAQRLGKICNNDNGNNNGGTPKQQFTNTVQSCTIPGTNRMVIVPAGVFTADSQAEANAQALDYANKLQVDPGTPPGVTNVPTPNTGGGGGGGIPGPVPHPTPQPPPKPHPNPSSQCKPCDDTAGVDTFTLAGGVEAGVQQRIFDTAPLKCGRWQIAVTGGPYPAGTPEASVVLGIFANDHPFPNESAISWGEFSNCPQPAWVAPCAVDTDCATRDVQQFALFPGCCGTTSVDCGDLHCAQLESGNFLMFFRFYYICNVDSPPARDFTIHGTWLGPITPP